jgi:hypothetical protein
MAKPGFRQAAFPGLMDDQHITIRNLSSSGTYRVVREVTPGRVVILYPDDDGVFALATLEEPGRWELATDCTPEESALLKDLEAGAGTLDATVVKKSPIAP